MNYFKEKETEKMVKELSPTSKIFFLMMLGVLKALASK